MYQGQWHLTIIRLRINQLDDSETLTWLSRFSISYIDFPYGSWALETDSVTETRPDSRWKQAATRQIDLTLVIVYSWDLFSKTFWRRCSSDLNWICCRLRLGFSLVHGTVLQSQPHWTGQLPHQPQFILHHLQRLTHRIAWLAASGNAIVGKFQKVLQDQRKLVMALKSFSFWILSKE